MAISRAEYESAGSRLPPVNGEVSSQQNSSENNLIKPGETVLFSDSNSILSKIFRDAGENNSNSSNPEQPYSFTSQSEPDRDVIYPPGFREEKTWGN